MLNGRGVVGKTSALKGFDRPMKVITVFLEEVTTELTSEG